MFLFLCSFSIAFWGCLVLFYFYLRFIKNFQIIREEFPFFSQFFTIHLNCCGGLAIIRNPGGRHSQVPHAVALFTFLSLCPRLLPWARSVRARYSFTLSLGCCRGLALCVFAILLRFPSAAAAGSLGFARSLRVFAQG